MIPGEIFPANGDITLNDDCEAITLIVANKGDRPIQVGSHYHFAESNSHLEFDRVAAYGRRLDIASGTAVRFEPGEAKEVQLVELAGKKAVYGGNDLISGEVNISNQKNAMKKVKEQGFAHEKTT